MSHKVHFSTKGAHDYLLCGWHTRSDISFTFMPTSMRDDATVDVRIRLASGHSPLTKYFGRIFFDHSAECSIIGIRDVAAFEVSRGQQIRVWPAAGATQKVIEIFLFGPAWAVLCHQRGLLPLHASAIVTKRGGITAFAGHCGAGKSTTAACMGLLGYKLVADDILPVSFNQNLVPGAWPYLRRLKLRNDSINRLSLTPSESVSEWLDKEKYFVRPKYTADDKWNRLERVYLLESDPTASSISIDRLTGAEAVRALIDQTYHFRFIRGSGRFRDHMVFCAQLASKIAIYRLCRPPSNDQAETLGSLICAHLEGAN